MEIDTLLKILLVLGILLFVCWLVVGLWFYRVLQREERRMARRREAGLGDDDD